ncbi:unnamed protein product, partial [Mesorhabditis belari]|uniref:Uncharacterized protein n=1 Tax=Mesorhabditis belari TaxID=2138241 RepID=A0AAF3FIE1_9BILA
MFGRKMQVGFLDTIALSNAERSIDDNEEDMTKKMLLRKKKKEILFNGTKKFSIIAMERLLNNRSRPKRCSKNLKRDLVLLMSNKRLQALQMCERAMRLVESQPAMQQPMPQEQHLQE